jgi:nitrate/nitrite transport system permease protein
MTFPKPTFSPAEPVVLAPVAQPSDETRTSGLAEVTRRAGATAAAVFPPLLTLLVILGVWQVAAGDSYVGLPSPAHVWADSKDLILHPFFDNGGVDKGLFWHVLTSLKRVGMGFSISAICGVMLGVLIGSNRWAHRGLDPIFQVLRTVPPLAWLPISLAGFREAQPSAIFVIFITSIWPIIINTAVGVRNIPRTTAMSPRCCG